MSPGSTESDEPGLHWARSILPAPALASRQWAHALVRRSREPARVAGFLEPVSHAHHVVMATDVGFELSVRELGTGRTRWLDVQPGELCIAGAGGAPTEMCWRSRGRGSTIQVVELYVDPAALCKDGGRAPLVLEPTWQVSRDRLLSELLRAVAAELEQPDSEEQAFGELATTLFAAQLERAHGRGGRGHAPSKPVRGGLTPFALNRVREYVSAHLASTIRLDSLATLAGLSSFHFARAFKVSTGLSPHAFVLHCRIAEAKRLLAGTRLPIADIARRTGFGTTGQLSTRFRAWTGTTPSAFRSQARP